MSKEYNLRFVPVAPSAATPGVVEFTMQRPFILIDSVAIPYPSTSPFNNLLLFLPQSQVINLVNKVDMSAFVSSPGVHAYNALALNEGEVQYVVVLEINAY